MFYSLFVVFFFKQKTAYERRISDGSSDVCSSDLTQRWPKVKSLNLNQPLLDVTSDAKRISYSSDLRLGCLFVAPQKAQQSATPEELQDMIDELQKENTCAVAWYFPYAYRKLRNEAGHYHPGIAVLRSEEHTSELQSLMRISYAVFGL